LGGTFGLLLLATNATAQGLQPPPAAPPGYSPYAQPTYAPPAQYPTSTYPGATQSTGTAANLDQGERTDSGRNFELVYAKAEIGAAYSSLDSFS
jgi:hypothetical protein